MNIRTEFDECVAFVEYLDILAKQKKIQMYSHLPNGAYAADWGTRNKNKRLGVSRGVPDYLVLTNKKILFIEMKRVKRGVVSPEQLAWIKALSGLGYAVYTAYGFDEAKKIIEREI